MDLRTAAAYLGCSYWTLRDLVVSGHVPAVRIPSPRAHDGRAMRRILIDSRDLDTLIEQWKEVNDPDANTTVWGVPAARARRAAAERERAGVGPREQ
jgi:hypothetical protein